MQRVNSGNGSPVLPLHDLEQEQDDDDQQRQLRPDNERNNDNDAQGKVGQSQSDRVGEPGGRKQ